MLRALLLFLLLCSPILLSAEPSWEGATRTEIVEALGEPTSKALMGIREIWQYDESAVVYFRHGRVEKVRGSLPARREEDAAPRLAVQPASAKSSFRVPTPTLVTDPLFQPPGTWGGRSDGKTIGIDGRPLADHKLYAVDSHYFSQRIERGLRETQGAEAVSRLAALRALLLSQDPERRISREEAFAQRYGKSPETDALYPLASEMGALQKALNTYDAAFAEINQRKQLKISDRLDLRRAPDERGKELRLQMRDALHEMETARAHILGTARLLHDAGQRAEVAEARRNNSFTERAIVRAADTPLFLYAHFENTPLGAGLLAYADGRILREAKPVLMPAGLQVEILEHRTVDVPITPASPSTRRLEVVRLRVEAPGLHQHDGRSLPKMRFEGWTLASAVAE